ncbi:MULTISPECIES: AbrB/MazE/SpoVT family DNA-binding domain-containing protein [unclassified Meiothermus]|uniref:AbrB/MazE/SpoVT family DNA-binding domain-containing protein n=1 Tax=unclassified Meiothermus TaxID=370471 RepID=UPI000D7C63B3|nr:MULTISPECIES: AbrB/MazE/SpoVT family DNA-binding domain-containing protein [unclassified Meiothermus]PZA08202.1 AbrB/MazE/SpoVT family DNA-binding domain-containing protein [Meiothermus sp. Pnk-1]RYM39413.1 AbrB/MazE/SpoVT family DNA-binding domain-containing protein [Meiothermus sp. PNK-Is4]
MKVITQVSPRGQITLPASVRKALGLKAGDALLLRVEEGRIVLEPARVLPMEAYTEERIQEFTQAAEASEEELTAFRKAWGL